LNPRPPGYEPGELPDCSTPRSVSGRDTITDRPEGVNPGGDGLSSRQGAYKHRWSGGRSQGVAALVGVPWRRGGSALVDGHGARTAGAGSGAGGSRRLMRGSHRKSSGRSSCAVGARRSALHLVVEPGAGAGPVALDGGDGEPGGRGDLIVGEAAEEPVFDEGG